MPVDSGYSSQAPLALEDTRLPRMPEQHPRERRAADTRECNEIICAAVQLATFTGNGAYSAGASSCVGALPRDSLLMQRPARLPSLRREPRRGAGYVTGML
jgi:hypothetical protein